jgi:hypothetical protein
MFAGLRHFTNILLMKVNPDVEKKRYKKKKINAALREQVWLHRIGRHFETKCYVTWCLNRITITDFQF